MKKRSPFLTTYVAVVLLLGLGAYIYLVDSKKAPGDEKPKERVFTLDKAKVKELTLAPREGEAIHLVREGGSWTMKAPRPVPADSGEVDSLVSSLESLEISEVVLESPERLADFGLESPKLAVSALLEGATEPLKLLLGDKAPDGTALYAKLPTQGRVFTVPSYVEGSFTKKPFDLRDRDVLHVKREDVTTLEIVGPEGSYALARSAGGDWAFTKPLSTRAGRWAVDGLLGTLESLRMESVAAEEAKDLRGFGLAKPVRTVTLGLAGGEARILEIGSGAGEKKFHARAAGSPLVAVVPGALVDDLAKGMANLRAKRLLDVATYEVEGFDVAVDGATRTYSRATNKGKDGFDVYAWKRTAPDTKELETNTVQDALFKVGSVEAAEFVDAPGPLAGYGLEPPALRVTLRFATPQAPASPAPESPAAAAKPPVWFEVGQKDGVGWARRSDDGAILELDAAKAEELLKAFQEL